ncbi:unnamed protein product [Rotaria socialis]|uniref:Uncharacterized protein n=2 Tax=Rotaria socialis TaxID=392032 RepID=A0A820VT56_9BILA|nr:unnamed protein product [Rotaria socialis]CAF4506801.1 unnamed protein product [Rotaria socialis]
MGSTFSTSIKQSADISGANNNVWMINGAKFNISLMSGQTIQGTIKIFQDVVINNNPVIIINIMLSTKTLIQQHVKEGGNAKIILGDTALSKAADTPVQTALKAAGKAIDSGSDLIAVPALWLKDMQKNWLIYMILPAIVLLTIAFLYCAVRSYFMRRGNNSSMGNLIELASVIANKNSALQTQLPLSGTKLSSASPSTVVDLGV